MSRNRILTITKESWLMFQRMFARSIVLGVMTILALALVDHLVDIGISERFSIVNRFPEFIPFILAAAKLTFIEMSVFWVRFMTAPKIDVQAAISYANTSPTGAAIVHFTNSLVWFARIAVFLYLAN